MMFHALMDEDELLCSDTQKPNASEFQQIVDSFEPKRFYSGVEWIIQFKQDPKFYHGKNPGVLKESSFYCKLCLSHLDKQNLMPHCASFVHLFRYFKNMYPIEYYRVINPDNLRRSIEYVIKLLEVISNRQVDMDNVPELILLKNLHQNYRQFTENYSKKNSPVDLEIIKLNDLINLNLDDENRILDEKRNEILRKKSSSHSSFIQHVIDSNRDDFISMQTDNERFANHKSSLRQRERGSMKKTNIVVKREKEPLIEPGSIFNQTNLQMDQQQPEKQHESESENSNDDAEEVSDDYLRQLATRIMNVIDTNHVNFEDEFIDSCTKYGELLIYKEYVEIENMEKLQNLFMRSDFFEPCDETSDVQNEKNQQDTILDFKQSPKQPEEPIDQIMHEFKESPKIPEEPIDQIMHEFKESPKIPEEPQKDSAHNDLDSDFENDHQFVDTSFIKTETDLNY